MDKLRFEGLMERVGDETMITVALENDVVPFRMAVIKGEPTLAIIRKVERQLKLEVLDTIIAELQGMRNKINEQKD